MARFSHTPSIARTSSSSSASSATHSSASAPAGEAARSSRTRAFRPRAYGALVSSTSGTLCTVGAGPGAAAGALAAGAEAGSPSSYLSPRARPCWRFHRPSRRSEAAAPGELRRRRDRLLRRTSTVGGAGCGPGADRLLGAVRAAAAAAAGKSAVGRPAVFLPKATWKLPEPEAMPPFFFLLAKVVAAAVAAAASCAADGGACAPAGLAMVLSFFFALAAAAAAGGSAPSPLPARAIAARAVLLHAVPPALMDRAARRVAMPMYRPRARARVRGAPLRPFP